MAFKYYSVKKVLRDYPDCKYYVIFGERSNGKTYSTLTYALEQFVKTGQEFVYLRRYHVDIVAKEMRKLMNGINMNGVIKKLTGGEWDIVEYYQGEFIFSRGTGKDKEKSDSPCGYAMSLSDVEHSKGNSLPMVKTIIFDEFIAMRGYIPNEISLFRNTISTIVRVQADTVIFMLGNTINRFCPYFREMGLKHIMEQKPGTIDIYQYGDSGLKVAVEYTPSGKKSGGKPSDVYFAFDNPEVKMITEGEWEIAQWPHLQKRYKPKDVVCSFYVAFDVSSMRGHVVANQDGIFVFVHSVPNDLFRDGFPTEKHKEDLIYTDVSIQAPYVKMAITKQTDKVSRIICQLYNENRVYFSDNDTGDMFCNYMRWSTDYSNLR